MELLHRAHDDERIEIAERLASLTGLPLVAAGDVLMHVRARKPLQDALTATPGVVGQFPRLVPGDKFRYNSYHLLDSDSTAEGAYLGKNEEGQPFITRIPKFEMRIPA